MPINKKVLITVSWGAHLVIALILCDLVSSIIVRIMLLVSIGAIGGIQNICIRNIQSTEVSRDEKR